MYAACCMLPGQTCVCALDKQVLHTVNALACMGVLGLPTTIIPKFTTMVKVDTEEVYDAELFYFLPLPSAYLRIPPAQFKLQMDAIVWAFKHTMRNVAEIGLNILLTLLQKFAASEMGSQFFQTYLLDLMQHIFSVVTDTSHTASMLHGEYMLVCHKYTVHVRVHKTVVTKTDHSARIQYGPESLPKVAVLW